MIVSCAGCGTKYRVSDDKIGSFGVKVRCPKCRTVFEVKSAEPEGEKPESLAEKLFGKDVVTGPASGAASSRKPVRPAPEPSVEQGPPVRRASPAPAPTPPPPAAESLLRRGEEGIRQEDTRQEYTKAEEPAAVKETAPESGPAGASMPSSGTTEAGTAGRTPAFPFKACEEDPRILARALVSDILFYNRDSRDRGLSEGKVLAYLGKEIARSWDTYKERVGVEAAVETDFFRDAVNEILGEGRQIL